MRRLPRTDRPALKMTGQQGVTVNTDRQALEFAAVVTRTVTAFVPTGERFENTNTGRIMDAGTISFDCGHSYVWYPHAMRDSDPMPTPGAPAMCADCIQAAIDAVKASRS